MLRGQEEKEPGDVPCKPVAQGQTEQTWGREAPLALLEHRMVGTICREGVVGIWQGGLDWNPEGGEFLWIPEPRPRGAQGEEAQGPRESVPQITLISSLCLNRAQCFPSHPPWSQEMALPLCQPLGLLFSVLLT